MTDISISRYSPDKKKVWDAFVSESQNATFLHYRSFMDYHSDRFCDHSLIVLYRGVPVGLFPANEVREIVYSHQGLTYGGLLLGRKHGAQKIIDIFVRIKEYYSSHAKKVIYYKSIPHIYHLSPSEEDLYAMFRVGAHLCGRSPSATIRLSSFILPGKKNNGKKRGIENGLSLVGVTDPGTVINLVAENLAIKYGIKPVHSEDELRLLRASFPKNIEIFHLIDSFSNIVGGAIIFKTHCVAHAQYLTVTPRAKQIRGMDVMIGCLIDHYKNESIYFDFGISSENNGKYLNQKLMSQKEEFGASVICYDQYQIDL